MRPRRPVLPALLAAALWLGSAAPAWGVEKTAGQVADAYRTGGIEAVRPIARDARIDLWLVAEHLSAMGAQDAAEALAAAAPARPAYAHLAAYVAWRAKIPVALEEITSVGAPWMLSRQGKHAEALAEMDRIEPKSGGVTHARWLSIKGRMLEVARRPPAEVVAALRESGRGARKIGWLQGAVVGLGNAANTAGKGRLPKVALALIEEALPLARELRVVAYECGLLWRASLSYRDLGETETAIEHATRAWKLAEGKQMQRTYLKQLLMLEIPAGYARASRRHLEILYRLDMEIGHPLDVARTEVQIASIDISLGRLTSALARIQKALPYLEDRGKPGDRRGVNLHAGKVWMLLSDEERALEHFRRAREAGKGLGYNDATLRHFEGLCYLRTGRVEEAETKLRAALAEAKRATRDTRIAIRTNLARALARLGRFEEANQELDRARGALGPGGPWTKQIEAAECFIQLLAGDVDGVLAAGRRSRKLRTAGLLTLMDAIIETSISQALLSKGDARAALAAAKQAVEIIVRSSGALPAEVGANQRAEFRSSFEMATAAAAALGDHDSFFEIAEQARAIALRTRMGAHEIATQALDPELREREAELEETESLAVRAYRLAIGSGDAARAKAAFAALTEAREQLERHRVRIRARQAVVGQLLSPSVDSLADARGRLAADEALVVYAAGQYMMYALVVTKGATRLVDLGDRRELDRKLSNLVFEDPAVPTAKSAAALRGVLLEPLGLPESARRIAVAPTGVVAWAPFGAALPDRELVMLPSATVGRMLDERASASEGKALAVGTAGTGLAGPLPSAADEAKSIGDVVLVEKAATEEALRKALASDEGWRAVHLACHGMIDVDHPMRSALSLLPAEGRDGLWTVSEILGTRVRADLVALSACSSARGKVFQQEGVLGFVHAFFVAGAKRVLVSLWDVDDTATSELMKRFYAAWTEGTGPAAALRAAQAGMRDDPRWKHPAYWAGWQLWGVH